MGDGNNQVMFTEGQETLDEQLLRERKSSLLRLFRAIDLKPRQGVRRDQEDDKSTSELPDQTHKRAGVPKTEVVGDGEEIEVDDAENLTENELDLIYKR
jgi:DNA repair protein RAD5